MGDGPPGKWVREREELLARNEALQETLHHALAAASRAQRDAEQANEAKSLFLATMSHELRTPLTAILGYAELLSEGECSGEQRADLDRILGAGRHLLGLVTDLLDLSRVEAGQLEVTLHRLRLDELVQDAVGSVATAAAADDTPLRVVAEQPVVVYGDATRLRQVLLNLLHNAMKFGRGAPVDVHLRVAPGVATVEVRDQGPGVEADRHEAIFQPFVQERPDIHLTHGGSGLGLAISRRLCEAMGAELAISSVPGDGACFRLRMPMAPEEGA